MTAPVFRKLVKSSALDVTTGILWLAMMSVTLIESDAYRYAAILIMGLTFTLRRAPFRPVLSDWLAIVCIAWGVFALSRFLFGLISAGEKGASEWLYAFASSFPRWAWHCRRAGIS